MTADELAAFLRMIEGRFGLRLDDRPAAMAELGARRAALHGESIAVYLSRVSADDPVELRALATELTVGETYFFRHAEQFHAFADVALGGRAGRGSFRVLSAGCSSGEEPYTIAMLARGRPRDSGAVAIHAIDVNPVALERAARARFSRWALRATPPELEQRWFKPEGRELVLDALLRDDVTFMERNLLDDGVWGQDGWDVVFCRNVLMYFTEEHARTVLARITRALTPGGFLFLGHAETLRGRGHELELCHTHGTFYYQRVGATASRSAWSTTARVATPALDDAWYADIHAASERVRAIVDDALVGLPVSTSPPAQAIEPTLIAIRELYAQERFAEALALLATIPQPAARDGAVELLRALVLTHAGRLAEAETACMELLAADLHRADACYLLALCRQSGGDAMGAASYARQACELDPGFALARLQLGLLARRAGDRTTASREFTRALVLLETEEPARLTLFGGGFRRETLAALCRAELANTQVPDDY